MKKIILSAALVAGLSGCIPDRGQSDYSYDSGYGGYDDQTVFGAFWENLKKPHPPLRYVQRGRRGHWDREVHR